MATDFTAQINAAQQSVTYTNATAGNLAVYNAELNNGTTMAQIDQQIVNDPFTTANVDPVIALYQAAFGRVPDAAGLKAEVQALESGVPLIPTSATSTNSLVFQFASSPEFMARYGVTPTSPSTTALVYLLYQNVLGRAPDAAGLAYWSSQPLNAQQLLAAFAVPSLDPEYAKDIAPQVKSFEYDETGASGSQPVPTTGSLFNVQVNAGSTSGSTVAGQTFNLTGTPTDVYTLTNADPTHKTTNLGDTFFLNSATPTGTIIQDGTGPNTLNISNLAATYAPTQISGVQTINDTTTANHTINFATVTGLHTVNDLKAPNNAIVTYNNLASNVTVGVSGETGATQINAQYAAGTTTANFNVGADSGAVGQNFVDLAVTTASGPNVTTHNLVTTGGNNIIQDDVVTNTALTTVNISGSGNLQYLINTNDTALATLTDSSTGSDTIGAFAAIVFTPAATVTLGNGADTLNAQFLSTATVTAGSGADTFNLTSTVGKAVTLTAGNGPDTISVQANAAHQISVGTGADTFNISETGAQLSATSIATATAFDKAAVSVTGFSTSNNDVLHLTNTAGGPSTKVALTGTQLAQVSGATDLLAAATLAHQDAGNTANQVVAFNFAGNTYIEDFTAAGGPNANDTLVKLVGISNALTLDAAHFTVA